MLRRLKDWIRDRAFSSWYPPAPVPSFEFIGPAVFQVLCRANLVSKAKYLIEPAARDAISNSHLRNFPLGTRVGSGWTFDVQVLDSDPGSLSPDYRPYLVVTCYRSTSSSRIHSLLFPVSSLFPEMAIVSEVMES